MAAPSREHQERTLCVNSPSESAHTRTWDFYNQSAASSGVANERWQHGGALRALFMSPWRWRNPLHKSSVGVPRWRAGLELDGGVRKGRPRWRRGTLVANAVIVV